MNKSQTPQHKNITYIIGLFFVFYFQIGFSQENFLKIENITSGYGYNDFEFPIISSKNKYVENKINIFLQLAELELLANKKEKHIFERVMRDSLSDSGKTDMIYEILNNTDRNLSIRFVEAASSYTMHYWNEYYNFNPQNGDIYHLKDFFETTDFQEFKTIVSKKRIKEISEEIDEISEQIDDKEYLSYILKMIEDSDLSDFYFDKEFIFFDCENMIHKNEKGAFHTISQISISEIAHLLNDFGKSVLITGKNLANYRSSNDLQLYEGTINGKSPFYLIFNSYRGIYAYKKYGKGIQLLKKSISKNKFLFEEDEPKEISTSGNHITFEVKGNTLKGHWISGKGIKKVFFASRK